MKETEIRKTVREGYAQIAKKSATCCTPTNACCSSTDILQTISKGIGYTEEELGSVPEGANLGLGCGNPTALASLVEGEIVLDLGSGAGFDCFLAANRVGKAGKVIGIDMTPEMVEKARQNAGEGNYENVEFRLGEIENLPAADNSVDVVISNCVINLSTDKSRVFQEALRVLKPGGRMMISDITLLRELPDFIKDSVAAYVGCISGALIKDEYLSVVEKAGFVDVNVIDEQVFPISWMQNDPTAQAVIEKSGVTPETIEDMASSVVSIKVEGIKPK